MNKLNHSIDMYKMHRIEAAAVLYVVHGNKWSNSNTAGCNTLEYRKMKIKFEQSARQITETPVNQEPDNRGPTVHQRKI